MRAEVWGSPIAHSLSPVLHRAAYAALGLPWEYDLREVDAAGLPAALAACGADYGGLSLTMPLKAAVLPLLAEVSPLALAVGAVNTVVPTPRGWRGENTDVDGMVAALAEAGVAAELWAQPALTGAERTAVVLGGGATAASALAALARLGVPEPVVHVRSLERARGLVTVGDRCGVRVRLASWGTPETLAAAVRAADIVVSTAPAGATDALAQTLAAGGEPPAGALLDVVYAPWPTALARVWAAAGGTPASGFAMLVHQAGAQVELMTGCPAPVAVMRAAGEVELMARSH